jgi:hypothetical protein
MGGMCIFCIHADVVYSASGCLLAASAGDGAGSVHRAEACILALIV